jgi:hypothetical protein
MTAVTDKSAKGQVTGALRDACDKMIWMGLRYEAAAKAAGLTARAMRTALNKPHVLRYLADGKRVLRQSEGCRTVRRLAELRDQDTNKNAAVAAARVLEGLPDRDHQQHGAAAAKPGLVIIVQGGGKPTRTIEHNSAEPAGELVADPDDRRALVLDDRSRDRP